MRGEMKLTITPAGCDDEAFPAIFQGKSPFLEVISRVSPTPFHPLKWKAGCSTGSQAQRGGSQK